MNLGHSLMQKKKKTKEINITQSKINEIIIFWSVLLCLDFFSKYFFLNNWVVQVAPLSTTLFGSHNHELLLAKLKWYGLNNDQVTFTSSYLLNRLPSGKINNPW